MRTLIATLALLLAGPALAEVPALTAHDLLGAIDVVLTAPLMDRYGLDEAAATRALDDAKQQRYLRLRAISALAIRGTETALLRIERAALADADPMVQSEAVVVIARAYAQRGDAAANTFLRQTARARLKGHPAKILRLELARLDRLAP